MTAEPASDVWDEVRKAFFEPMSNMQTTLAVLCDCQTQPPTPCADTVTQTLLTMLSCPLHIQLTAAGWQPFKGKELTFPYQRMSIEQRAVLKKELQQDDSKRWSAYEHALMLRQPKPGPTLKPIDVLEALCAMILHSTAYTDRRLRVAICNILLQRVQASMPIDKITVRALNGRLFPA